MEETVAFVRAHGFDIARLGGLCKFYSRFGWVPFPRRYVEFTLESVKAGARTLGVEEVLGLPSGFAGVVRPFDGKRDAFAVHRLRRKFNAGRTGALRLSPQPEEGLLHATPHPLRVVYERSGKIYGYVNASELPREYTEFEGKVSIHEVAFDLRCPEAVEGCMKAVLLEAFRRGVRRVTARMPFDHLLLQRLTEGKITYSLRELQGAVASNMILIVSLSSLFRRILPELARRLANAPEANWQGTLRLQIESQFVDLQIAQDSIKVVNSSCPDEIVATDSATLMKLVFGLHPVSSLLPAEANPLPPAVRSLLHVLFPPQATASGPWG